jgi:hypothetical protein
MVDNIINRRNSQGNKRIIKCECGKEILILPDIKQMDKAINYHANEHASKEQDAKKAEQTYDRIQEALIKQLLALTSKAVNKEDE